MYPAIIKFLGYVPFRHDGSPGGIFRFLRRCVGLSQEDLADRLRCALTTLWRLETNQPIDLEKHMVASAHLNEEVEKLHLRYFVEKALETSLVSLLPR